MSVCSSSLSYIDAFTVDGWTVAGFFVDGSSVDGFTIDGKHVDGGSGSERRFPHPPTVGVVASSSDQVARKLELAKQSLDLVPAHR
jgi:hypothetical protein